MVEYAVLVDIVNPVSAVSTSTCSYCTSSQEDGSYIYTVKSLITHDANG